MSQALYRRYRSKSFSDVVGQEHITELLSEAIKRGAISHAYLFTGPRGTGKTSVARILAYAINQLEYTDTPHLDIIEIDAASNRRIDDIRDLRDKVHIAPTSAKYKVYIIDEVHMLTGESFNALLKTLEEPPAHAVFILATTELHKVPATIISRTQRYHFRPGTTEAIAGHLASIAKKEKINIDANAINLIAQHSEGGFRDALSLLDQVNVSSDKAIDQTHIENLLGLAPSNEISQLAKKILEGDTAAVTATINQLYSSGNSPIVIVGQLNQELAKSAPEQPLIYELLNDLLDVGRSNAPNLKLLALLARFTVSLNPPNSSVKKTSLAAASNPDTLLASKSVKASSKVKAPKEKIEAVSDTDKVSETPADETTPGQVVDLSWDGVLEVAQKRAPALYSVLKRADADCSTEKIVLTFQYALHRKKLSDSRYRTQLSSMIVNTFGCNPELIITDKTEKPLSSEVAAVADIMGGGKPVNA